MRPSLLLALLLVVGCDPARQANVTVIPRDPGTPATADSVVRRVGRILHRAGMDSVSVGPSSYCRRKWEARTAVTDSVATAPLSVCLDTVQSRIIIRFWEGMGRPDLTRPSEQLRRMIADSLRDVGMVVLDRAG